MATNRTVLRLPVPLPPFPHQATADPSSTSQEGIPLPTLLPPRSMSQSELTASTRPKSPTPRTPTPGFPSPQQPLTMQRDIDLTIGDIVLDLKDSGLSALGQISEHIVPRETHESPLPQDTPFKTIQRLVSRSYLQTDGKRGSSRGEMLRCRLLLLGIIHHSMSNSQLAASFSFYS